MRVVGYLGFILISAILTGLYYWRPSETETFEDDRVLEDVSDGVQRQQKSRSMGGYEAGYSAVGDMVTSGGAKNIDFEMEADEVEVTPKIALFDLVDDERSVKSGTARRRLMKFDGVPSINNSSSTFMQQRPLEMKHDDQAGEIRMANQTDGGKPYHGDMLFSSEEQGGQSKERIAVKSYGKDSFIQNKEHLSKLKVGCFKKFLLRGSFRLNGRSDDLSRVSIYEHGPWFSRDDKKCKNGFFNKFLWFGIVVPYALVVAGLVMCFLGNNKLGDLLVAAGAFLLILQPAFSLCGGTAKASFNSHFMDKFKLIFGYADRGTWKRSLFVMIHVVRFFVHTVFFAFSILCLIGMFDEEEEDESKEQAVEAVGDAKGDVEAPPAQKSAPENKDDKEADKDAVVQVADSSSDAVSQDA
jgi:hypothetical protein